METSGVKQSRPEYWETYPMIQVRQPWQFYRPHRVKGRRQFTIKIRAAGLRIEKSVPEKDQK